MRKMAEIAAIVAREHLTAAPLLRDRWGPRYVTKARHDLMARLVDEGYSLKRIAIWLGGMHPTSVLSGVRAHRRRT